MRYTDKNLSFEPKLIEKIELMIKRSEKRNADNLLIIEGPEGTGKSNIAAGLCYYMAWRTGRTYTAKENVFFETDDMIKYAVNNEEKIIHWDEAAIAGLASEWQRKTQKKLIKLLMMARKKKHFYIFCIPKFQKLNDYLIDRAIGIVRVYAKGGLEYGRFVYYNEKAKQALLTHWKKKRWINYKKYSFHGKFSQYLAQVISEEDYEGKKDQAIMDLVKDDGLSKNDEQLIKLKYLIYHRPDIQKQDTAQYFGVARSTLLNWGKLNEKYPDVVGISG